MTRDFPLEPLRGSALRYVESQSLIATTEFVDTAEEQHRLEALLDAAKPALPPDVAQMHWLLRSAFRYPPLPYGSRFGPSTERGILYLSEQRSALVAEMAFYDYQFYAGMAEPPPTPVRRSHTVIRVAVATQQATDTRRQPDSERLSAPDSWQASQAFGTDARGAGVEVIRYPSARTCAPQATNLAVLSPRAVANAQSPPTTETGFRSRVDARGVWLSETLCRPEFFPAEDLQRRPF